MRLYTFLVTCFVSFASNAMTTPCGGPNDLISFLDRPTAAESACVVPERRVVLENGYQYQTLSGGGTQQNLPESFARLGLANRFEVNINLPNYLTQTVRPRAGFSTTTLGIKHEIGANTNWVAAIDGSVILPAGSASFGNGKTGGIVNGLFTYNLTQQISFTTMLGLSSQSEPIAYGGKSYNSFNPDFVLSWAKNKVSFFGEIYGQTKTAPNEGSGYNVDAGIIYLLLKNVTLDVEIGKRISGDLGGFNRYFGVGLTFLV